MYQSFYHLHTEPFRLTPDPAFCFRHKRYARAFAYMQYALQQGEGFIMVTGMPGTGKTTLLEQFHSGLDSARTLVAKLTSTQLQVDELLRMICLSLGVIIETQDKASVLHELRQFFIQKAKQGRRILLLIDEAQDLPMQALEELRLLSNLQLNGRPLLQIYLVGQQHLLDMVEQPAMRPLYQRLVAACHLEPLGLDETRAYIEYRLQRAGWTGGHAFDERSYRMIHHFSEGFPRQINKVCTRLMLYGSTEEKHTLDGSDCLQVLRELLEELPNSTRESSFQACVDLLNESGSVPAESGNEVNAPVHVSPLAVRHPPSSADQQVKLAATPEPQTVHAHLYVGHVTTKKMQAVSAPRSIERWDVEAARENSLPTAFMQPEERTMDAAADLQSTVPLTVGRSGPENHRWHSMISPELLHNRTSGRAGATLVLLMALLTAIFFVSSGNDGAGPGELAAPSEAPELPDTVARFAPESLITPPGTAPIQESASPDDIIEVAVPASLQTLAEASSLRNSSQAAEPLVELPVSSGDSVAFATLADGLLGLKQLYGKQEASAETAAASASSVQSTQLAATAPATPGNVATVTQPEPVPAIGLHDRAMTEVQVSASASLAGFEVAAVTPPTEAHVPARTITDLQTVQASAEQLRIDELMASAEQALRASRLTIPKGSSAWDFYRQVLEIEPQHHGANAGIQRIADNYAHWGERALAADQIDKARNYVTRGLMVSPGNRKLLTLKQDVTARESLLETQASLAAAAAAEAAAEALRVQNTPPEEEKPPPRFFDRLKAIFSNPVPRVTP